MKTKKQTKENKPLIKKEIPAQRRTFEEWMELQTNDYESFLDEKMDILYNLLSIYPIEYIIPESLRRVEIEITKESALQIIGGKKVVEICPCTKEYQATFIDDKVEELLELHDAENDDICFCIDSIRIPEILYFYDSDKKWQLTALCENVALINCNERYSAIYKKEYNDDTVEKLFKSGGESFAFAIHIGKVLSYNGLKKNDSSEIKNMELESPLNKREIPKQRRTFEEWQELEQTNSDKLDKEVNEVVNELLGIYPIENIIAQPLRKVNLIMKKEFAKEILKGEKGIEWRPASDHYVSRLIDPNVYEFINLHEHENDDVAFCISDLRLPTVIHFYSYSNTWHLDVICDEIERIPCTKENAQKFKDEFNDEYVESVIKSTKHLEFTPCVFALHIGKVLSHSGL